jgi:glutaredoxin-like protein NrdH
MTITLLSKNACVQCSATKRALDKAGLEYTEINVTENEEAYDRAISLGHMAAPVVIVEETGENWAGFRPEKIASLVA